jgi:tetratricopeptide (TPR) repeat protein
LNKLLRGDLDWIAMKALEKDRTRRYETVHGLARDIERHLNDEPVRARPPSIGYRLKKYVRKHRVAAAATLAVLAALVVGLALMGFGLARARYERRVAMAERDHARENLQLARQLMSDLIGPATDRMIDFPFAQDFRREMLEQARLFHERILQQAKDDPQSRHELALIHRRLGGLAWLTGQDAGAAYRYSVSIMADLVKDFPSDPGYRKELSDSHNGLSIWLQLDLRFEEAVEQQRISLKILRDLAAEFPSNEKYRQSLLAGSYILGRRLSLTGRFGEAENYHREALTADGQLTPFARLSSRLHYAYLLQRLARYEQAERVLQEALQIGEREVAPDASPPMAAWQHKISRLASCHSTLGLTDFYTAQFTEAETHLHEAIDLAASGLELYPYPVSIWREYLLGSCHHYLAEVLTATERIPEAEQARHRSLAAWKSAGTLVPATFLHHRSLAHYRLGELLHRTARTEEAQGQFVQARAMMEDLARRRPDESVCHWQLICLLANCPDAELRDPPRAVSLAKRVLPEEVGHYWRYLALAQYRSDQWDDAADSIQQAMDLRQGGDAFDWLLLAMTDWQLGQKEEALQWYARAQEAIETGKPLFYRYVGAMAVQRLRSEAEKLLGERIEAAKEE